jgi:hypothetical protein
MIITMRAMREMQVARDEVIDMVSMGDSLMSAVRAMAMCRVVPVAPMGRSACRRVLDGDRELMFIDMVAM